MTYRVRHIETGADLDPERLSEVHLTDMTGRKMIAYQERPDKDPANIAIINPNGQVIAQPGYHIEVMGDN